MAVTPADLRGLFSRVGNVLEVKIIAEYGFVRFERFEDALEAIKRLDGVRIRDTDLEVGYSDELEAVCRWRRNWRAAGITT